MSPLRVYSHQAKEGAKAKKNNKKSKNKRQTSKKIFIIFRSVWKGLKAAKIPIQNYQIYHFGKILEFHCWTIGEKYL